MAFDDVIIATLCPGMSPDKLCQAGVSVVRFDVVVAEGDASAVAFCACVTCG